MGNLTRINCSLEQEQKIYRKHLRWLLPFSEYVWDDEDNQGFYSGYSIFGGWVQFQMRDGEPCFFSLQIGSISYDISHPKGVIYDRIKQVGIRASKRFWRGGQI